MSTAESTPAPGPAPHVDVPRRAALATTALALAVAAVGLSWAKWWPYAGKTRSLLADPAWPGADLLVVGAGGTAVARAWEFTASYTGAVWKALLVALLVAAAVETLVPRRWLLRALSRRTALRSSVAGGLLSLPGMMCTCCAAPLAATMRAGRVPASAALAFWWGNPALNPAVLVFLLLVAPGEWAAVRLVGGVLLVFGVAAVLGSLAARHDVPDVAEPVDLLEDRRPARELPARYVRRLLRRGVVLVPEYLVVVFAVGLLLPWLAPALGEGGLPGPVLLAMLVAAVVGAVVVLPTGGEIPVLLALAAAGASPAVLGVLLLVLPTISLPSLVMVAGAFGRRTTAAAAGAVLAVALACGGALALLSAAA